MRFVRLLEMSGLSSGLVSWALDSRTDGPPLESRPFQELTTAEAVFGAVSYW
ncbi:hypothetical protein NBRC3293_0695 [Gluconobacter oxydans NBRC 3293]|uniref:Uncharacterized protein n=1 Tax=Gluconobacter oxydans NBRC 3293 TaxID=1315969 RepID=A0A829WHC0_GLUOY|nr:hypothetical protein NBRC3293_0695 [Gluconobacter oxydans NBRC 3293]